MRVLRDRLTELGYRDGQNLALEVRSGHGRNDRLPALATDLIDLGVDVLVTGGPYALEAARHATATIPIVFAGVGTNFAPARGGGNLTGVAELIVEVIAQRLELLKEAVPQLGRVAILANPDNYGTPAYVQPDMRARRVGLRCGAGTMGRSSAAPAGAPPHRAYCAG